MISGSTSCLGEAAIVCIVSEGADCSLHFGLGTRSASAVDQ